MTLDSGNDGIFLIMGNAGFISSTVLLFSRRETPKYVRFVYLESLGLETVRDTEFSSDVQGNAKS